MQHQNKTVVLGVTGGIAAYKAADLTSRLVKLGISVYVIMTQNATQFIAPLVFETLSSHPVVVDMFAREAPWEVEHISLAKRADVFLIAPATANVIAKMAHGIADDMLTSTVLATQAPVLVAPAMNTNMYNNPATQDNIALLQARGMHFVGPGYGKLAEGTYGIGRLIENETIVDEVERLLYASKDLSGKKVMVTAGPTREEIDPVRYISNHASGKMGYELAKAAKLRGADVLLITGPSNERAMHGIDVVNVVSTHDLYEACTHFFPNMDIAIMAAAPADFTPEHVATQKIKKVPGQNGVTLDFVNTQDVAATLGHMKTQGQMLTIFAAETQNLIENAKRKLFAKHADMVVLNDVSIPGSGFNSNQNTVTVVTAKGEKPYDIMDKDALAHVLLNEIIAHYRR